MVGPGRTPETGDCWSALQSGPSLATLSGPHEVPMYHLGMPFLCFWPEGSSLFPGKSLWNSLGEDRAHQVTPRTQLPPASDALEQELGESLKNTELHGSDIPGSSHICSLGHTCSSGHVCYESHVCFRGHVCSRESHIFLAVTCVF